MPRVLSDYAKKREIFLDADCSFPVQILLRKYEGRCGQVSFRKQLPVRKHVGAGRQQGESVCRTAVVPNERKKTVVDSQRYEKPLCITQAKE